MSGFESKQLQEWLDELYAEKVDLQRTTQLAAALSQALRRTPRLRQLIEAMRGDMEDRIDCETCQIQMPDFLHAQQQHSVFSASLPMQFSDLRNHLALCPYCMAAYVQVAEWLIDSETDHVPVAAHYPNFELNFLNNNQPAQTKSARSTHLRDLIDSTLAEGKQWFEDTLGGINLLLGSGLQIAPAAGWVVKSSDEQPLLGRVLVGEEALPGCEIEAAVFAEDTQHCRVEVAIYSFNLQRSNLADIEVHLNDGVGEKWAHCDHHGVVSFHAVPRDRLENVVIRVVPAE